VGEEKRKDPKSSVENGRKIKKKHKVYIPGTQNRTMFANDYMGSAIKSALNEKYDHWAKYLQNNLKKNKKDPAKNRRIPSLRSYSY
jgi:hypothetical protein